MSDETEAPDDRPEPVPNAETWSAARAIVDALWPVFRVVVALQLRASLERLKEKTNGPAAPHPN